MDNYLFYYPFHPTPHQRIVALWQRLSQENTYLNSEYVLSKNHSLIFFIPQKFLVPDFWEYTQSKKKK